MSKLATLVSQAIRRGAWKPENPPPFFHMSKDIARHARRGFDTVDLDKALAVAVYREMSYDRPLPPTEQPLYDLAREIFESCPENDYGAVYAHAYENAGRHGTRGASNPALQYAVLGRIEQDSNARVAEFGDPYATIQTAVDAAKVAHPRLGLSNGYIGNVGIGPNGDDRSWMVFAKLATARCHNACDVNFGSVHTDRIEDLAARMGEPFQAWLAKCEADLDAGLVRIVGERATADPVLA